MNDDNDLRCTQCGWEGMANDLIEYVRCPKCNTGKYIEDSEETDPPIWAYHKPFNWNKK